ncbi:hypothetical protein Tco_0768066 [Tanacetum coccineum]
MDDPNITMEEYIRLEEEKACRRGKVYNWETATYGKIWDNEDVHDLGSVENEFPAIVFNDTLISKVTQSLVFNDSLTSEVTLTCEPTVSPLSDNKFDFKMSFDESDDEDYTIRKMIMIKSICLRFHHPSIRSVVYNDDLMSKSDSSTEPIEIPHCIDEFDLKTETSLSECDEKKQNILYFKDLFHFNIIHPDDLKSEKDNDDDKIDIKQSSGANVINTDVGAYTQGSNKF